MSIDQVAYCYACQTPKGPAGECLCTVAADLAGGDDPSHGGHTGTGPARSPQVPDLDPAAWHGPAAEYVQLISPDTEADPLAVYAQILAWAGARVGRGTYTVLGAVQWARVWPLLCGATATGRKGTSEETSLTALSALSSLPRTRTGLSSGEGLIQAFLPTGDDPPPDERLLIVESEWETVLSRLRREGNTLSGVLRDAWDGRPLSTLTVSDRTVDVHHLVVVGHITPTAMRLGTDDLSISNGFLNRFLGPLLVHRPHLVPFPDDPDPAAGLLLEGIVDACRTSPNGRLRFTPSARSFYSDWYISREEMRESWPDRVANTTARGPANLARLAVILAVLDQSNSLALDHVTAAAAMVEYADRCAHVLLGPGRAGLDHRILDALSGGPLSRSELRDHLNRHVLASDLTDALEVLVSDGAVEVHQVPTGGRPRTVYSLTSPPAP